MSDSESLDSSASHSEGSNRRRRSFLYRFTDKLTSFLPSLFVSRQPASSGQNDDDLQQERPAKRPRTSGAFLSVQSNSPRQTSRLSISRVGTINVPSVYLTTPIDVDVDLDARDDRSDISVGSGTSVSTSGVSSLLPRSSRNEHNLVKSLDYGSDYVHQKNNSNARKRESTELWINLERTRHDSSESSSTFKRVLSDNSESSVGTSFTSPFYHGRVSYGGAASLRPANRNRSIFEHVTPLRFIMENDEEERPEPQPAFLSATAQSILQSLEKHGSIISSSDKIPLPKSIPFSPLSVPLQRSTTRYPSYMATYNRYKEFKKQSSVFRPSLSTPDAQFLTSSNRNENDNGTTTNPKTSVAVTPKFPPLDFSVGPSKPSTSTSQTEEPPPLPAISEQSHFNLSQSGTGILKAKRSVEVQESESQKSSEAPTVRFDTKPQYEEESEAGDGGNIFAFSEPISLKPLKCSQPPIDTSESRNFSFTKPKSQYKKAAPAENSSFLPTLLSPRPSVSDELPVAKKAMIPSDLCLWRCESCLTENSERDDCCKSCRMPNASSSIQKPLSSEKLTFLQAPRSAAWECPTCLVKNKAEASKCVCCQSSNPSCKVDIDASREESSAAVPVSNFVSFKSSSSAMSLSTSSTTNSPESGCNVTTPLSQTSASRNSKWECPTCLVSNDVSREECICCATHKPTSVGSSMKKSEGTPATFNFGSSSVAKGTTPKTGFLFDSGSAKNLGSVVQFGTPVSSSNSSLNLGSSSVLGGFDESRAGTQSSNDKWECPSCLVRNSASCEKCVCCQTAKPNSNGFPTPKPSTSSSIPSFNFGASSSTSSPAHSGFVFGNASSNVQCGAPVTSSNASTPEEGKWECSSCLVMNAASASKCICCATAKPGADSSTDDSLKTPDVGLTASMGSPPIIMSAVKSSSNSYSQNAAPSFSLPFKFGEAAKPTVNDSAGPPFSSSKPVDSGVDSSFKLGYKSATFSQPVIPIASSFLKNGGFQFSSPSAVPVFDFSAKKEVLTPAGESSAPLFSFGAPASSTESASVLKWGEPKPPTSNAPATGLFNFNSSESGVDGSVSSAAGTSSQEPSLNGRPLQRTV